MCKMFAKSSFFFNLLLILSYQQFHTDKNKQQQQKKKHLKHIFIYYACMWLCIHMLTYTYVQTYTIFFKKKLEEKMLFVFIFSKKKKMWN